MREWLLSEGSFMKAYYDKGLEWTGRRQGRRHLWGLGGGLGTGLT